MRYRAKHIALGIGARSFENDSLDRLLRSNGFYSGSVSDMISDKNLCCSNKHPSHQYLEIPSRDMEIPIDLFLEICFLNFVGVDLQCRCNSHCVPAKN